MARRTRSTRPKPKLYDQEVIDFFWTKVNKEGPVRSAPHLGPCWDWLGYISDQGYPYLHYRGLRINAGRYAWKLTRGPIRYPHLDHLCHSWATYCIGNDACPHRQCVRPDHRESVTARENARRAHRFNPYAKTDGFKTMYLTCPNGHVWSEVTTLYNASGKRECGDCLEGLY